MRKALVVGINQYGACPLNGCINDANEISKLLDRHSNGEKNFDVKLILDISSKSKLRNKIKELFKGNNEIELFYFSGHGYINELGGYVVTPDYDQDDWGVSMNDIINYANQSKSKNKIIILDCCHSGAIGSMVINDNITEIGNGVTILTASNNTESAMEINGHGVFTQLLIEALNGGAANLQGNITPGSIYAYIDQALGAWDSQRPLFKTNISNFVSIRNVEPRVLPSELKILLECFSNENEVFPLDPSFEFTNTLENKIEPIEPYAKIENVKRFKLLQRLESVDLVEPVDEQHMYFAAMKSKTCRLTPLGKYYWKLLKDEKI